MTNAAAFSSWEERKARYFAYGGTSGTNYTSGVKLPGMSPAAPYGTVYFGLANADPRASVVYPDHFRTLTAPNATYEPTAAQWPEYALIQKSRYQAISGTAGWAVVDLGAGQIVVRNTPALAVPDFDGTGTGFTATHAFLCYPHYSGDGRLYLGPVFELNASIVRTNGAPVVGDTFSAQNMIWEFR